MTIKSQPKRIFRREPEWKVLIEEWRSSGKSVAVFCKEKKIAESGLYYWRSHFYPNPKAAKAKPQAKQSGLFVPVAISDTAPSLTKLILAYPNGCQLQICTIDLNTFKMLNQVMGVS